jgi:hypothetical protein
MNYVRLGKTGLKISRLALGCMSYGDPTTANAHTWALNEDDAQPYFRQAVEMGITFWDTANTYQAGTSEEVVGRAIQRYSRREDIVLATTVFGKMHDGSGGQGLSRKAILEQVDGSLTRLAPTTSTSTRSTASTPRLQSQRPWRPSTTSSRPGRSATSAPPPCLPGSSPNFNTPPNFTAGPRSCRCKISTTCYGGKMNGSCCPCAPTWASAPSAVFPSGQRTPGSSLGRTVKAFQRGQGCPVLRLTLDEPVVNAVQSVAEIQGRDHGSSCAGVGAGEFIRLRADRRSDQAPSPARSGRSTRPASERGRAALTRGALHPAGTLVVPRNRYASTWESTVTYRDAAHLNPRAPAASCIT